MPLFLLGLLRKLGRSKWTWIVLGVAALIGVGVWGYQQFRKEQQARVVAELQLHTQIELASGVEARLAHSELVTDSLVSVVQAANKLHGKLIAAVAVWVAQRDTQVDHPELPTTDTAGTRTAAFRDSSFAGVIEGTVIAPPYPSPLGIRYHFIRPAFRPEIGFVRVGDSTVAVVAWNGETVRVTAPYAAPAVRPLKRFGAYLAGDYAFLGDLPSTGQLGLFLRPFRGWEVTLAAAQETDWTSLGRRGVRIGIRKDF